MSLGGTDALEDADHAILFFNHAVVLYHLKQHRETIRILEKLFQVIEPLGKLGWVMNYPTHNLPLLF